MAMEKVNRFNILNEINVNEHVEQKNKLTYLSWAWAWQMFKQQFPESYYTIYENEHGWNYFTDGRTCWVKTGATLVDGDFKLEHIEDLPVMDFKNNSIPVDKVTSFDVNKAIQRSLTKAIERHGLGCYIYAGEDLPDESDETKQRKQEEAERVGKLLMDIKPVFTELVKDMTKEQKQAFATEVIIPIIGSNNYMNCKDADKLQKFFDRIRTMKAE